jgi:hypothetical protein
MKRSDLSSTPHYTLVAILFVVVSGLSLVPAFAQQTAVPERLTDEQFWNLSKELSEEDGVFRSDNLLSNETTFQWIIPDLLKIARQGRVYMGVGPEQNFTYIAALKPAMAVIVDIRHGNLDVHLMYKALFELSKDRVDFVSRLFSRKKPESLKPDSSADEIFSAILSSNGSKELYEENLKAIEDHLMKKHGFPLSAGDREGIAWALGNYYRFGPLINYNSSLSVGILPPEIVGALGNFGRGGGNSVNYANLMTADDGRGQYRSYLANEENFNVLKDLETRNMLIPVVGDFGGDKALRAVAKYLKSIGAMVSAFYLSNVEQYLIMDNKWDKFCLSANTLPLDETSMFIRSGRGAFGGGGGVQNSAFAGMLADLAACQPVQTR